MKNFAGIDVQAMYPAEPRATPQAAEWTFDAFLKAAEACAKAGFPFGMGLAPTPADRSATEPVIASSVRDRAKPSWARVAAADKPLALALWLPTSEALIDQLAHRGVRQTRRSCIVRYGVPVQMSVTASHSCGSANRECRTVRRLRR